MPIFDDMKPVVELGPTRARPCSAPTSRNAKSGKGTRSRAEKIFGNQFRNALPQSLVDEASLLGDKWSEEISRWRQGTVLNKSSMGKKRRRKTKRVSKGRPKTASVGSSTTSLRPVSAVGNRDMSENGRQSLANEKRRAGASKQQQQQRRPVSAPLRRGHRQPQHLQHRRHRVAGVQHSSRSEYASTLKSSSPRSQQHLDKKGRKAKTRNRNRRVSRHERPWEVPPRGFVDRRRRPKSAVAAATPSCGFRDCQVVATDPSEHNRRKVMATPWKEVWEGNGESEQAGGLNLARFSPGLVGKDGGQAVEEDQEIVEEKERKEIARIASLLSKQRQKWADAC